MKLYRSHILVAEDSKSLSKGAKEIEELLTKEIRNLGLENEVLVAPTGSLGFEDLGVAIAVYPDGVIYAPVKPSDIPYIVKEHLLKGRVVKELAHEIGKRDVTLKETRAERVLSIQERVLLKRVGVINPESIEEYIAEDGYMALEKAIENGPEWVLEEVKASELRGRGGAGFPTGKKWEFTARAKSDLKYVICNADEGEPGTFKDRVIMEGDPNLLIEGMVLAGYATGANYGYIYIRGEYDLSIKRLQKAIEQARSYGFLGENILGSGFNFDIEIKKGAGAYICGEETALIESIEGKRGEPRKKPPYPPTYGLWGKPTVINNVETLANIPPIVVNGAEWFKKFGVPGSYGTKLFSLMGDVNYKGVIEIPFGEKLSSIINDVGFGVKGGKKLKGVILGGVSGSLITPAELDTPVDFNSLAKIEAGPGSGSIVVLSEDRCIVDIAKNIAYFFRHESCGKCTPCRVGTEEMYKIIDYISRGLGEESDLTRLEKLSTSMKLTSFCGLGQTAPNIIAQSLVKYRDEWLEHIKERKCKANVCEFEEITEEVSNE
ncbi:NADH-quinone oxidoreductase subunit NuoF [Caldisericum exile]|uniref:Formate dehydrogenase beta subunit n=1 Tax=Caldisericum exile (strain DSM 21853 / NBRC 104410 / AZM16c01) TaxID=511051 RepID=A0A7U6JGD1_CALEA|nr:NADH-quinone oxidoreductase subunit NuoF [Caldisericum exile]BAL81320.1 putative formate dehydrogenase beta subunit [Caldisericum exile AZM16c01]